MTTITALPTPVPQRSDPTNFAARADLFLAALPTFATETNLVASEVNTNALTATAQASAAVGAAIAANDAKIVALAAANFKNLWSNLTGSLNTPASVKHNGRFWLLLNNLANVTASEPGVSSDWISMDAGVEITQKISTNTTGVQGVIYIFTAPCALTLPQTGWIKGDRIGYRLATSPGPTVLLNFGTLKFGGQSPGDTYIDIKGMGQDFIYEDATVGLV